MSLLISNALLYGVLLSAILAIVMGISFGIAPDMWVGDYPPDIKASYGEMSQRAKKYRPIFAILFFGSVLFIPMLAISRLRILTQGNVGFWSYFLSTFITLMVFNLFDLLVVDWLIFVAVQPKSVILPGTEGMAGYKDYGFHFRGFLIGIGFSAVGALIVAILALLSVRLFCLGSSVGSMPSNALQPTPQAPRFVIDGAGLGILRGQRWAERGFRDQSRSAQLRRSTCVSIRTASLSLRDMNPPSSSSVHLGPLMLNLTTMQWFLAALC